tara:strand:- start:771 stop:1331 length:561 start_codon:yes stop_codon:yes gene_type:complete
MKLNLGSGSKILDGYINVDKYDYYKPDIIHDLEVFPYPFEDNSIEEILLSHVLEHIGQSPEVFLNIIKEFYRICKNNSVIKIKVPHPRHDDFISDPTHVRPITILGLQLFDKDLNLKWEKQKAANTPLALINNVNFKITNVKYNLDQNYTKKFKDKNLDKNQVDVDVSNLNNVVKEIEIDWLIVKS